MTDKCLSRVLQGTQIAKEIGNRMGELVINAFPSTN